MEKLASILLLILVWSQHILNNTFNFSWSRNTQQDICNRNLPSNLFTVKVPFITSYIKRSVEGLKATFFWKSFVSISVPLVGTAEDLHFQQKSVCVLKISARVTYRAAHISSVAGRVSVISSVRQSPLFPSSLWTRLQSFVFETALSWLLLWIPQHATLQSDTFSYYCLEPIWQIP